MSRAPATVHSWLIEPLTTDVQASIQRIANVPGVLHIAVMPDVHLAQQVCVGLVVATENRIYPQAVGSDIGCGMAAIAFDCSADLLLSGRRAAELLQALSQHIPIIRHRKERTAAQMPAELRMTDLGQPSLVSHRRDAEVEFATLGRGNHFLEFQADEEDRLWLMVHSGSRGVGQAIANAHTRLKLAGADHLIGLESDSSAGMAYLNDMTWARKYARESRSAMVNVGAGIMRSLFSVSAVESSLIECDHNHVERENHFGSELWVHRKGATRAGDGVPGIIPGSMGTCSFHALGRGLADALCSSSHGAGRALSRTDARHRISSGSFVKEMHGVWFDRRLAPRLRDEAPSAYKDVTQVMRAQHDLTRIVRKLKPLLVYKGA